jgi:hypothetical protein
MLYSKQQGPRQYIKYKEETGEPYIVQIISLSADKNGNGQHVRCM